VGHLRLRHRTLGRHLRRRVPDHAGRRITSLDPPSAFAAQTSASILLYVMAFVFAAPISTTQAVTSSVLGTGASRRLSSVRWGVGVNIVLTWVLTIPSAALVAALCFWGIDAVIE
jgi:PiT family inorganic phosphate transporter